MFFLPLTLSKRIHWAQVCEVSSCVTVGFVEKQMIPWHHITKSKDESMTLNYSTVRLKQGHCPQQRWSQTNLTSLSFPLNPPFCPYSSHGECCLLGPFSFFWYFLYFLKLTLVLSSFYFIAVSLFSFYLCLFFVCFVEDLCNLTSLAHCSITEKTVLGARKGEEGALSYLVTRLRGIPLLWVWWVLVFS